MMDTRRWIVVAAVVAVLMSIPGSTFEPRREAVETLPPPDTAAGPSRVDTLATVVADVRAIRWMMCRSPELPRHQRCEAGKGER